MTHYQDIHLLPDEMTGAPVLMNLLFGRLHGALVQLRSADIGVSFPEVGRTLGNRLRLHGPQPALAQLDALPWPGPLASHIRKEKVLPVPERVQGHRTVSRRQFKSSPERLRRRLARRHGLSAEEAARRIPDQTARMTDLPFIQLKSASTGQHFRLFIEHGPLREHASPGSFSPYGLSATATVPWF